MGGSGLWSLESVGRGLIACLVSTAKLTVEEYEGDEKVGRSIAEV